MGYWGVRGARVDRCEAVVAVLGAGVALGYDLVRGFWGGLEGGRWGGLVVGSFIFGRSGRRLAVG